MMSPKTVSLDSSHLSSEEFKGNFHHPRLGGQLHKISDNNADVSLPEKSNTFDERLNSNNLGK